MNAVIPPCVTWWRTYRDRTDSGTYDAGSLRIMRDGGRRWLAEMARISASMTPRVRKASGWDELIAEDVSNVTVTVLEIEKRLEELLT